MNIRHFQPSEISGLSEKLVKMLDNAREISGVPFVITSGNRKKAQNDAAGGVSNSLHTKGLAVDLKIPHTQFELLKMSFALGAAGFKQVGFYTSHIHVELDPKDTFAFWKGTSH